MNRTALLAGASGGIGLALLQKLVDDPQISRVFATCRREVVSVDDKVTWLALDFTQPGSLAVLLRTIRERTPVIDRLICAPGYLHDAVGQPEKRLDQLLPGVADSAHDQQELAYQQRAYLINALGPLQLFAGCAPLLKISPQPIAMFLSAQVGSISDNHLGGWYGYRMAKAALNMGVRSAAIEAQRWRNNATVVAVHPGTTRTHLSAPFIQRRRSGVQSAATAASQLHQLLETLQPEQNGTFVRSNGEMLPW
ncbi:MAG: SDR family NAD(P)-dependent oxidoreductase [Pseudomonadota bacterium]